MLGIIAVELLVVLVRMYKLTHHQKQSDSMEGHLDNEGLMNEQL